MTHVDPHRLARPGSSPRDIGDHSVRVLLLLEVELLPITRVAQAEQGVERHLEGHRGEGVAPHHTIGGHDRVADVGLRPQCRGNALKSPLGPEETPGPEPERERADARVHRPRIAARNHRLGEDIQVENRSLPLGDQEQRCAGTQVARLSYVSHELTQLRVVAQHLRQLGRGDHDAATVGTLPAETVPGGPGDDEHGRDLLAPRRLVLLPARAEEGADGLPIRPRQPVAQSVDEGFVTR